jgi:hypothetical protein
MRAARERYLLDGHDMDTFADEAARWMQNSKTLAGFPPPPADPED